MMRIGLAFDLRTGNEPPAVAPWAAEWDTLVTVETLERALRDIGCEAVRLGNAQELVRRLHEIEVDLVLNLTEGHTTPMREAEVPALLERLGIPYVGSRPETLVRALDKAATKAIWRRAGLPTPKWGLAPFFDATGLWFPAIVKPRYGGSGMGVDPGAVVRDAKTLGKRCAWVERQYRQPAFVESFVDGADVTVFIIGTGLEAQALPVLQRPVDAASGLPTYLVPQENGPRAERPPVALTPQLESRLKELALLAHRLLQCRDMSRVDGRVDPWGQPWLLEINPLPSFEPSGSFGMLAEVFGVSYAHLLAQILASAVTRYPELASKTDGLIRSVLQLSSPL